MDVFSHMINFLGQTVLIVAAVILFVLAALIIMGRYRSRKSGKTVYSSEFTKLKGNAKSYREAGLSDNDIRLFCENMAEAKTQITYWENARRKFTDLSVVEDLTGGLSASKKIYQFIISNPQELTKRGDFLYKQLPDMKELIQSYRKLRLSAARSATDVNEVLSLIKALSSQMAEDYNEILMKDVKIIGQDVRGT